MDGNFDSQFFLLSILIFFLFPVFSAFVFFSLSLYFDLDLSGLHFFTPFEFSRDNYYT